MRVIGVDPGSRLMGWGVVERVGTRLIHVAHGAVLLADGRVLVAGGSSGGFEASRQLESVEVFDPKTETWTLLAPLREARWGPTVDLLQSGKVLVTGGGTEIEHTYGREIASAARFQVQNLIGKTTLKQLLAILQRASVVLCPDSGPAHMATAVGTPVVGLYATSNRHRTGPYFSQHLVVDKYPEAVAKEFGRPIEALRWGQRVRDPAAMSLITVADVVAKMDAAFAERGIAPVR